MRLAAINPGKPESRRLAQFLDREDRILVPCRGIRRENILRKCPCRVLKRPLLLVQFEIHSSWPPSRPDDRRGWLGVNWADDILRDARFCGLLRMRRHT